MSFRIVKAAVSAEKESTLHEARLLLLLLHAEKLPSASIDGITKLAKMDFLVRYPRYLARVVKKERKRPVEVPILEFEVDTVESKMIRFRYGPWDGRYRTWIGILAAKDLIVGREEGRNKVRISLTEKGRGVAEELSKLPDFLDLSQRSEIVCSVVGKLGSTRIKDLIYEVVPELSNIPWGKEIEP